MTNNNFYCNTFSQWKKPETQFRSMKCFIIVVKYINMYVQILIE